MLNLEVCIGSTCHIKGSYNVINAFQQMVEEFKVNDKVEINAVFCLGRCQNAVSVRLEEEYFSVSGQSARAFFKDQVLPRIEK